MSYANIKYRGQAFNRRHNLTVVVWLFVLLCCFSSKGVLCAPVTMQGMQSLPAPATMPTGSTEQVAEKLAHQLVSAHEDDLPNVLVALQASGIGVVGPGKTILLQPLTPSQGIAFDSWEVQGIALAEVHGMQIPLSNISAVLSEALPALKNAPLDTMLLDCVRADTKAKNPQLRLWADLIIQLGLQAPEPYDLRQKVDPANVRLDAVQAALILRRLMGDVYALSLTQKKAAAQPLGTVHLAGFHPPTHLLLAEKENCTLTESDMLILDNAATGLTTGFETVIEYIEEYGFKGAGAILHVTGIANVLLSYLKFVMIYANLNVAISMDGAGPPLVRTKSSSGPGEQRQLKDVLSEDLKNSHWANCARTVANQMGLDFDLPNDGPVKGAEVSWRLVPGQGGTTSFPTPTVGYLEFYGNPLNLPTDENGAVHVGIEGRPQKKDISPNAPPKMKDGAVWATVQVQPANIIKDLTDATAAAVPLRGGNPLSLLSLPPNLLYRTMWFSKTYTFAVKDWTPDLHIKMMIKNSCPRNHAECSFECDLKQISSAEEGQRTFRNILTVNWKGRDSWGSDVIDVTAQENGEDLLLSLWIPPNARIGNIIHTKTGSFDPHDEAFQPPYATGKDSRGAVFAWSGDAAAFVISGGNELPDHFSVKLKRPTDESNTQHQQVNVGKLRNIEADFDITWDVLFDNN